MAASITINPTSGSFQIGGTFVPPTVTAFYDDGVTDASGIVTSAPAPDMNTVGDQIITYTLPATAGNDDTDTVTSELSTDYTLTITALPTIKDTFLDGSTDRFGNDTTGTKYEELVQAGTAPETAAALFDEEALDPYEVALSKA